MIDPPEKRKKIKIKPAKGLLIAESFPYLFTLIVGFIAFQYNQVADEIKDSPFIQYKLTVDSTISGKAVDTTAYTCKIDNISTKTRFKSVQFTFAFRSIDGWHKQFYGPAKIVVNHPSAPVDSVPYINTDRTGLVFVINNFQPESTYDFQFQTTQPAKAVTDPEIYITSQETMILKESSFFTWCIRNQLPLNALLLCLLVLVLSIYFVHLKNSHYEGE